MAVALEPNEEIWLRTHAIYALRDSANSQTRRRLIPLALGEANEDNDDQLRGAALRAVGPTDLTATELFSNLPVPHNDRLIGAYHMFLTVDLIGGYLPIEPER